MVDLQGKTMRELNNRMASLRVQMANIDSNITQLARRERDHELLVRRLKNEIRRKENDLSKLNAVSAKFEKDLFGLNQEGKNIKKRVNEVMAQINILRNV